MGVLGMFKYKLIKFITISVFLVSSNMVSYVQAQTKSNPKISEKIKKECDKKANFIGVLAGMKQNGIDVKSFNTSEDGTMPTHTKDTIKEAIPMLYAKENRNKAPQEFYLEYLDNCLKSKS